MANNYPQTEDTFVDPVGTNTLGFYPHSAIETAQNNALRALEGYLGVTASLVTSSITYGLTASGSINPGHRHTFDAIVGVLSVTAGGTGSTSVTGSLNTLLPDQTGNAGKFLETNGTDPSWQLPPGGGGAGFSGTSDLFINNNSLQNPGCYDKVTGRYYIPLDGITIGIYQPNTYGSWELINSVTAAHSLTPSGTVPIYGICTDGLFVYFLTQYGTTTSTQQAIDIVRMTMDGVTQVATNIEVYLTGSPSGKYSLLEGGGGIPNSSLAILNSTLYAKVFLYDGVNFNTTNIIPFAVSGTAYTPGTAYIYTGGFLARKRTMQTSDGITFYGTSDATVGNNLEKYSLSGTLLTLVSSTDYSQIARGQGTTSDGSFILTLIDNQTFFTIPYQVVYSYADGFSTTGSPERTLRADSYVKP